MDLGTLNLAGHMGRANHGEWARCTRLAGTRLRGGTPQCPCFVLKLGAGPQGYPLMGLLKQLLMEELAGTNSPEIE